MPRAAAAVLLLLLAGLYAFAVGAADGRRLDDQTIRYYLLHDRDRDTAQVLAHAAAIRVVVPAALALIALVFWRRGRRAAIVAAALLAGAVASARALKAGLEAVDPFGSETSRHFGSGYFPSGHTTAIMALVLVVVLFAARGRSRAVVVLAGGAFAAFVGLAHVIGLAHHPSDLVGGSLLAGAWALGLSHLPGHAERAERARPQLREGLPALIAAAVLAVTWVVAATRFDLETVPAAGTAGVAVGALAVVGIVAALTPGHP